MTPLNLISLAVGLHSISGVEITTQSLNVYIYLGRVIQCRTDTFTVYRKLFRVVVSCGLNCCNTSNESLCVAISMQNMGFKNFAVITKSLLYNFVDVAVCGLLLSFVDTNALNTPHIYNILACVTL